MKRLFLYRTFTVVGLVMLLASPTFASTGFIESPLWLTPDAPKAGDTVILSAVFHNAEPGTLTGTILFYDNDVLLSRKPVTILSNDVATVTASFSIAAGRHEFSATMSNANKLTTSGKLEVVIISTATVQLPQVVVTAQPAGDAGTQATQPILNQIDKAETSVLNAVPLPAKKAVSDTTASIDSWRSAQADSFTKIRDEAKRALDQANAAKSKSTKKSVKTPADTGPFTYAKYLLFAAFAFLFSSPVIFYLLAALLIFLVLRFIFRRIRKAVRKER